MKRVLRFFKRYVRRNIPQYALGLAMLVATNNITVPLPVDTWKSINEKWLAYNQNYK